MHFDWKGIVEGAWNSVFVKDSIEELSKERTAICRECPHNSENVKKTGVTINRPDEYCTLCGCNLHMKTRALSQTCPDKPPRWLKVMEETEEWRVDAKLMEEKLEHGKKT